MLFFGIAAALLFGFVWLDLGFVCLCLHVLFLVIFLLLLFSVLKEDGGCVFAATHLPNTL
jgi:hypothetical protein